MSFTAIRLARSMVLAGAIWLALQGDASPQSLCAEVDFGRLDSRPLGLPSVEKIRALDSITAVAAEGQRRVGGLVGSDWVESRSPEIRNAVDRLQLPMDTLAALVAFTMRGALAGFTNDQAIVSADLYRHWRLPSGPAARLLGATETPTSVRSIALRAVYDRLENREVRTALVRAVCGLVARWEGIAARVDPSGTHDALSLLADDERQFLSELRRTLRGIDSAVPSLKLEGLHIRNAAIRRELQSAAGPQWH
jgi:hypothetical protein